MNKTFLAPCYPTTPVQDRLGQVIVNFGISKIEAATIQIAAGLVSNPTTYDGKILPETIADEAYNIALSVLEKLDEEYKKTAASVAPAAGSSLKLERV